MLQMADRINCRKFVRPKVINSGSRVGTVVRVIAFHQCVPDSIPALGVISGLSLLVLYSAPRGFSPGTLVFLSRYSSCLLEGEGS